MAITGKPHVLVIGVDPHTNRLDAARRWLPAPAA
jgi:hypothetical protein